MVIEMININKIKYVKIIVTKIKIDHSLKNDIFRSFTHLIILGWVLNLNIAKAIKKIIIFFFLFFSILMLGEREEIIAINIKIPPVKIRK